MEKEFAEVVDSMRDEGRDTEIMSTRLGFLRCKGGRVNAGEIEESVLIVGAIVGGGLVVGCVDAVKGGVNLGLDAVEGGEDAVGGVEVFAGGGVVAEGELDV